MPSTTDVTTLTSALTAVDCKILIFFLLQISEVKSFTCNEIADSIGKSRQTTASALRHLDKLGLLHNHGDHKSGKWLLTVSARQFILGESQPPLSADSVAVVDVKKFNIATCSSLNTHDDPETLVVATATSTDVKKLNIPLQPSTAITFLIEHGYDRTRAADVVHHALDAGWTAEQCLDCLRTWYAYAHSPAGSWIKSPVGFAAYALEQQRAAPQYPEEQTMEQNPYISGAYRDVIKH